MTFASTCVAARRLGVLGLGLTGLASLAVALPTMTGSESSPWTPPTLDVGVDLSQITLSVSAPAPAPTAAVAPIVGPAPAPVSGALDHDHDGDGIQDHTAEEHAAATARPAGSLRVVGEDAHDFGELMQGAVVDHTFVLESAGDQPLIINSVKASCGCTVAVTERIGADGNTTPYAYGDEIAPGDQLRVTARLNTDGKKNRTQSTLTVISNDTAGQTVLRLSAQVQPFLELAPNAYINFGKLFSNETKTESLRISSQVADAFMLTLEQAQPLPEYLSVELSPVAPNADGKSVSWELVATIGPGAPESPSQNWPLRLVTDVAIDGAPTLPDGSSKMHSVTAYTVAQVVGLVSANPYYVSFGLVRPGQELERVVTIEVADDTFEAAAMPVTVRGRQPSDEELLSGRLTADVTPVPNEPSKHLLTVDLADIPDTFNGPFGGYLDIEVGHPTKQTLTIPFSGVVRNTEVRPAPPVPAPTGGGR
ncbi:MAG: DUF1573 domain-containing protein [Planctomycetota bacterium]|jgi:hypothetical protein